jgi:uncharacterized protein (DUF58 family)
MSISRQTLLLIGLIVLFAIIGIWTGAPIERLWRWPAVVLLVLIVLERFRLNQNYTLQRQIAGKLALGEPVEFAVRVNNPGRAPLILESQCDYPENIDGEASLERWQLAANQSLIKSFFITPTRLGESGLGRLYLKQLGCFGLCWWTRSVDDQIKFQVEPVRLENSHRIAGLQHTGNRQTRFLYSSGLEFLDLNEYRPGDSLRSIDWKASARRGKPIVRRFERENRLEMVVLIDCGRSSSLQCQHLDRLHHYVNIAAKLTEFAAMQGDRIACIAYAQQTIDKTGMLAGVTALQQIRRVLAKQVSLNETANALNAALEIKQVLKRRGLVVFLTEIEQPEAALQLIQASKLLAAKHQVLIASLEDPLLAASLKQPAKLWQDPYRLFAGLEYRHGRELSCKQLQRLGVAVTSAKARDLDQKILNYYHQQRDKVSAA